MPNGALLWLALRTFLGGALTCAGQAEIQVDVAPMKPSYALGEPIAVRLTLRNASNRVLNVPFAYPGHLGLFFSCNDEGAAAEDSSGGAVPIVVLSPGEELTVHFALREYLRFSMQKRYKIEYTSSFVEFADEPSGQTKSHQANGRFEIEIRPGQLDTAEIAQMQDRLRQAVKHGLDTFALFQLIRSPGKASVHEAAETIVMLLWTDEPCVVRSLELAEELYPFCGWGVVRALGRLAGREPRAAEALLRIAKRGVFDVCRTALDVCVRYRIPVPASFYHEMLSSPNESRRLQVLQHLREHGTAAELPLIEPLKTDPQPLIAELALEASAAIRLRTDGRGKGSPLAVVFMVIVPVVVVSLTVWFTLRRLRGRHGKA